MSERSYRRKGQVSVKRTMEIKIDTRQVVISRRSTMKTINWCGQCRRRVRTLTPLEAALESSVSVRMIYRWIELQEIHSVETSDGFLLVCLESLAGS